MLIALAERTIGRVAPCHDQQGTMVYVESPSGITALAVSWAKGSTAIEMALASEVATDGPLGSPERSSSEGGVRVLQRSLGAVKALTSLLSAVELAVAESRTTSLGLTPRRSKGRHGRR